MGKFYNQLQVRNDIKERKRVQKETRGKFFYDLAKITFTLAIISGIPALLTDIKNTVYWTTICIGFFLTLLLSFFANNTLK